MPIDMKLVIAETFKDLLRQGNVDKITVKSLIQECHISRQTFYYHFQDITQVMAWSIRRETEELLHKSTRQPDMRAGLRLLVEFTVQQFPMLQKILDSQRRNQFQVFLTDSIRFYLNGLVEWYHPEIAVNQLDREIFLDYNARALTAILLDYCGRRDLDRDRLAQQLERLLFNQLNGSMS